MGRFFAVLLIICLVFVIIYPVQLYTFGSPILRVVHQFLFSWETRDWNVVEGEHFVVKYKVGDEKTAQIVLQEADELYYPLGRYFGCFPDKKVSVAIYQDKSSLNHVFGWGNGESAMGVYWAGVIRLLSPQDWLSDLTAAQREQVFRQQGPLAHEYIHLLVDYKTRGNYPRWLTEGVAQFGEKHFAGVDVGQVGDPEALKTSLAQLDKEFDDSQQEAYSYAVSEDLVEFLVNKYGVECIPLLLEQLGKGENMDRALNKTFGVDINEFVQDYHHSYVEV